MPNGNKYSLALPKDAVLHSRYKIQSVLGVGGFGITYLGYDIYNENLCAIKELFINDSVTRAEDGFNVTAMPDKKWVFEHGIVRFMEEAEILHKLNGTAYVVKIIDYFKENQTAYFVMEYIKGLTLKGAMQECGGRIPFDEAKDIIYKVGKTLKHIYDEYSIIHRDLSPDNILIDSNGQPKIIDFGNAKLYVRDTGQSHSVVLKPGFAPPEQYTGKGQGPWTDVYSLAGVFYYICTGTRVPPSTERLAGAEYIPLNNIVPTCDTNVSNAVDKALLLDASGRTADTGRFVDELHMVSLDDTYTPEIFSAVKVCYINGFEENWAVPKDTDIFVGRDSSLCNIVISGISTISKQHCVIKCEQRNHNISVTDISTNGTFCNGERLRPNKTYEFKGEVKLILGNDDCCLLQIGNYSK